MEWYQSMPLMGTSWKGEIYINRAIPLASGWPTVVMQMRKVLPEKNDRTRKISPFS